MTLGLDEQLLLERILEAGDVGLHRLSSWEAQFLVDHSARYEDHGPEMRISPKQWAILTRIEEKVGV